MRPTTAMSCKNSSLNLIVPILIILSSFLVTKAGCQIISGRVLNDNNIPLNYVTTSLKVADSIIKVTVTDSLGYFTFHGFEINKRYSLLFSRVGYQSLDTTFHSAQSIFILKKVQGELKAVTVAAKHPLIERAVDRLIFNVEDNVNTAGLNAFELLAKTPLVNVRNEVASIVGKDNAQIFINGRPSNMSPEALRIYLKALQSNEISKIEVITNPSAVYDPEGNGGIINIVIKKIKKAGLLTTVNSGLSIARYLWSNGSINFNYNRKRLSMYGGVSVGKGINNNIYKDDIFYSEYTWKQVNTVKEYSKFVLANVGFEVPVWKKGTLNASYSRLISYPDNDKRNQIDLLNVSNKIDSFITTNTYVHKTFVSNIVNVHLSQNLDSLGKKINVDLDIYTNLFNNRSDINNVNYLGDGSVIPNSGQLLYTINDRTSSVYSLNTVFILPVSKGKWDFGSKLSWLKNENTVALYRGAEKKMDTTNTNEFMVHERIQALFINYNRKLSKKLELQMGVRGEYTHQIAESEAMQHLRKQSYFSFFPSGSIKYAHNGNNVFSFSYGRRFNRTNFGSLNPFRIYQNYFSYTEGNPYLKPYYSNNLEITHTYKNALYYSLSFSSIRNAVRTLNIVENNNSNVQVARPYNFMSAEDYGITIGESFDKFKWLSSSNEFSLYYSSSHSGSALTIPSLSGWGSNFRSSNSIFLNKTRTVVAGIDLLYQGGDLSGISRNKHYYFLDLACRYRIPKKQLQVSINARDVLNSKNIVWSETVNGIVRNYFVNNNSRRLSFSLNYSFGNNKVRKANPYSNSGSEQGRVN